jgi:MFS family permease
VKSLRPPRTSEPRVSAERPALLGAFQFRDFRLLWFGLLVSNLGTWMQFTALGFYVVKIAPTPSLAPLYVGLIGASRAIPVLLLSPIAGVIADRYPRRRVLLITNVIIALLALVLALVMARNDASLGVLMAISTLQAGTQAFDSPARQSWIPLMVGREYVGNAIGLNSFAFNSPSIVGPPIAGILIASTGVATCAFINAAATLAVVAALLLMKPVGVIEGRREPFVRQILDGVRFLAGDPVLRWVVLSLVVTSLFVRPYTFLMPAYAAHIVHTDARGLGILLAASGLGAIGGAFVTAMIRGDRRSAIWFWSCATMSLLFAVLGTIDNVPLALPVLVVLGSASLTYIGTANFLLQTLAPDDMRGRAISVYSMILLGLVPAGSLLLGSIASIFDLHVSMIGGGAISLVCALWFYLANPRLREA